MFEDHLTNLPHGREFRFIDHIDELVHGKSAEGRYSVRGDEDFFLGHFPGMPILPGVIIVESVAQLAGIVAQSDPDKPPLDNLRLCAIRHAKITGTATPGQELLVSVRGISRLGNLVQAAGEVKVSGKTILKTVVALSGNT